jgi:hypothetical protein
LERKTFFAAVMAGGIGGDDGACAAAVSARRSNADARQENRKVWLIMVLLGGRG